MLNQVKRKSSPGSDTSSLSASSQTYHPSQPTEKKPVSTPINAIPKGYQRPTSVDPAVARLKELRRQEKEKAALAAAKNKPASRPRSTPSKTSGPSATIRRKEEQLRVKRELEKFESQQPKVPQKKLTYAELMQQAKEKSKVLNTEAKEPSPLPDTQKKPTVHQSKSAFLRRPTPKPEPRERPAGMAIKTAVKTSSYAPRPPSTPKPLAKPSAKLQEKLRAKEESERKRRARLQHGRRSEWDNDEDDDEMSDDFIVDDDEEQDEGGYDDDGEVPYDRDEIWKMFNKGKSRRDYSRYDDDLSDMEATGYDVEREERLAAKRAKQEDLEEEERERQHREEKRRRLAGKR